MTMGTSIRLFVSFVALIAVTTGVGPLHAETRYRGLALTSHGADIDDVSDLAQFSLNVVRYGFSWPEADSATEEEYADWISYELDRFDSLLPGFAAQGIKVILTLGSPPGGFADRSPPYPQYRVFSELWAQEAFLELWSQIAFRYAGNETILAYGLMNEPAIGGSTAPGLRTWYELQRDAAGAIRAHDQVHPIVITAEYSHPAKLGRVKMPRSLGPYLYTIHMYYPVPFLYQAISYPALSSDYPTRRFTKSSLAKYLKPARKFQRRKRASIYVAEFTTSRFGPSGSGARYLDDLLTLFERYRWHWTYHAWRESIYWSLEHDSLDPNESTPAAQTTDRALKLEEFFSR